MPKVSVIVPTFNASIFLPETLTAIRSQTFTDHEVIIVDDKSTDNTREVFQNLGAKGIRYHYLEQNHGGPSRPRNIGTQMATGEYIAFCDSDDIWQPDHLAHAVNLLNSHHEVAMVFTDEEKIDDSTGQSLGMFLADYDQFNKLRKKQVSAHFFIIESSDAFPCLFFENFIMPSGVVIRKQIFENVGLFDEDLTNGDDRDMWFRITRSHAIGYVNLPGFKYRIRRGSISGRGPVLAENRSKVLRKQMELGLPAFLEKQCLKMIAKNLYGIGYFYQSQSQMKKAREQYLKSISTAWNWAAARGLLITLLGSRLYDTLWRITHRHVE